MNRFNIPLVAEGLIDDSEKMRALEFYLRKENAAAPVKAVVVPAAQLREASV